MAVLAQIKSAVLRCTGTVMEEAFASTDQVAVEMVDLVNEVARDISKAHDWQLLTQIHEFPADGTTEIFPRPAGYDRMVQGSTIDNPNLWFWNYYPFDNVNQYLRYKAGEFGVIEPGGWILLGNEFRFYPPPSQPSSMPYVTGYIFEAEDGTLKLSATADNDTFRLPERLLTLGLIWKWKAQKGLEYAEDMSNYEIMLSQEAARDKGARVIRRNGRIFDNARTGWPWQLGPNTP